MNTAEILQANQAAATMSPEEMLQHFSGLFEGKIVLASSLGAEDMVLTHMIHSNELAIKVFTLDTGRLFNESYNLIARIKSRYGIDVEVYYPERVRLEAMVREHGINLFYESLANRKLCCGIRKTEPLKRALSGQKCWITGLRRDQAVTRTGLEFFSTDKENGLLKLNPLLNWSESQVWDYIRRHNVSYNPLHDKGFRSIGCAPCTRAVAPGDDIRSGRWWWENPEHKECGLHSSKED